MTVKSLLPLQGESSTRVTWRLAMSTRDDQISDALQQVNLDAAADIVMVGGSLATDNLKAAYASGLYPWPATDKEPLSWWCPDPRFVVLPSEVHIGRTVQKEMRRGRYRITLDRAFGQVIRACQNRFHQGQRHTWITPAMRQAYCTFHDEGYAHSVEAWEGDELVGGLYGVSLGGVFFGESMFTLRPNASKVAFASLVSQLQRWGFDMIDCQMETPTMQAFGGRLISRKEFLRRLEVGLEPPTRVGLWRFDTDTVAG
jgi:leucyl/phenylalanyl-tRNA--protein transferase